MSIISIDEVREKLDLPPWALHEAGEPVVFTSGGPVPFSEAFRAAVNPGYVTKDSGEREEYSTGMQRDVNDGKPRFDLIMPAELPYGEQLLTRWAQLLQRGAVKYNPRNWEKAATREELDRFRESAFRHFLQWFCGESDEDHAAACLFNISGAELVSWRMRSS
jgi:hypothetical protein